MKKLDATNVLVEMSREWSVERGKKILKKIVFGIK